MQITHGAVQYLPVDLRQKVQLHQPFGHPAAQHYHVWVEQVDHIREADGQGGHNTVQYRDGHRVKLFRGGEYRRRVHLVCVQSGQQRVWEPARIQLFFGDALDPRA